MKIVDKKWGREEWITNDEDANYCMKRLFVNKGWECSLHYHAIKDETFYIVSGRANILLMKDERIIVEDRVFGVGESVRVPPYYYHKFSALEDTVLIEASTFHMDDDSYRMHNSGKFTIDNGEFVPTDSHLLAYLLKTSNISKDNVSKTIREQFQDMRAFIKEVGAAE